MKHDKLALGILVVGLAGLAVKAVKVAKKRKFQQSDGVIEVDILEDETNE